MSPETVARPLYGMMQTLAEPVHALDSFEETFVALFVRAARVAGRVLGDRAAAEDVAAETMARALTAWSRISPYRQAWVTRVATNLALDAARRRRPRIEPGPVRAVEDEVVARLDVVTAMSRLPRRQRQAVALRYLVGLDDGQVAEALGLSPNTVKTHVRRGLGALRDQLGPIDMEEEVRVVPLDLA